MAIRRNFNEEVTEEAPTPVSNDPNELTYDKTDAYSQDVPAGDEGIAGTVDVDLDSKDEVLKDDGVPTLNVEAAELNEVLEQMNKLAAKVKAIQESRGNDNKIAAASEKKFDVDKAIKEGNVKELKKLEKVLKKALAGIQKAKSQPKSANGAYWELPEWLLFLFVPFGWIGSIAMGKNKTRFSKEELNKFEGKCKAELGKVQKALTKLETKKESALLGTKNESTFFDEDAFFEAMIAKVLKEDNAIDDKKEDEHECDKTVDVADQGDGVNVTDTISGVIDDEKEDNEISDREIKPDVDGVAVDKTVVVNNESYRVRITATKLD